ncbi:glycosyltransferase [Kocuria sediminis]|uniref:glycosyltransferase n=1 Tax=Kocuria sediminis TaxID=1038857 RepID=UPI0013917BCE
MFTLANSTGAYGGPAETAARQSRIAADLGYRVQMLAGRLPCDAPYRRGQPYKQVFVPVKTLAPFSGGFSSMFSWALARQLWRSVGCVDIVHVSFAREMIPAVAAFFSIVRRRRLIIQPHGMLTSRLGLKQFFADIVARPLYRCADVVVALTEHEKADLATWCPRYKGEYVVCGNPVPGHDRSRVRQPAKSPTALFVARLHPRKRVGTFVEAAWLDSESKLARFVVAGPDGGDLDIVTAASRALPNFDYVGAVAPEKVLDLLDSADVFVLTSVKEPWGNVLVSALSLGIPVIVNQSAALAETIQQFGAGVVVEDGNAHAVHAALSELLQDKVFYEACSRGALHLIQQRMGAGTQEAFLLRLYG